MVNLLSEGTPWLHRVLSDELVHPASAIIRRTVDIVMRDGVRLATDLYLPPGLDRAPALVVRTPYGKESFDHALTTAAQRGYVGVAQDCRGTGGSEPDSWDFYVFEREDSYDFVEWITEQDWYSDFIGSFGGSYVAGTQWCMAAHPAMSAIVPLVGGFGVAPTNRPKLYMFVNAYSRSVGKGADIEPIGYEAMEHQMLAETLAGGFFSGELFQPWSVGLADLYPTLLEMSPLEGQRWLWNTYAELPPAHRATLIKEALGETTVGFDTMERLPSIFGHRVSTDAHLLPHKNLDELARSFVAPALMITGWYDWALDDALASWKLLEEQGLPEVSSRNRLLITPNAHNQAGYLEGLEDHPDLSRSFGISAALALHLAYYDAVRNDSLDDWPKVTYYMLGANEWREASAWPPPEVQDCSLFLTSNGAFAAHPEAESVPDSYLYDPEDPTPTLGGNLVSYVYTPGSVDVSVLDTRSDFLTYVTEPLTEHLELAGPIRLTLYASSSATDTDFAARICDVFPDGRAIQLQNTVLRTRFRDVDGGPQLLDRERVYQFEIDIWSTANQFKPGHRLRLDVSSADFPRYDRNSNLGSEEGLAEPATQTIFHDRDRPSCLVIPALCGAEKVFRQ